MPSILPKNELENYNVCPSLLGQKFFVHFLEELKKTKIHFDINRPLVYDRNRYFGLGPIPNTKPRLADTFG